MQTDSKNDHTALIALCAGKGFQPLTIEPITEGGSGRRYYRLSFPDKKAIIGTCGENIGENKAFIYLSNQMRAKFLPVPEIIAVSSDFSTYLQTDVGKNNLFDLIRNDSESGHWSEDSISLFRLTVRSLPSVQFKTLEGLDFSHCLSPFIMDGKALLRDLNYFKYCFLKPLNISFDEEELDRNFDELVSLTSINDTSVPHAFILRDCQSRNVMFDDRRTLSWIDFQNGRLGPVTYDLASLLYQTRAAVPDEIKELLVIDYFYELQKFKPETTETDFRRSLRFMAICRLLQVLGAYGLRGVIEGKVQFLTPIPSTLRNLLSLLRSENLNGIDCITQVLEKASTHEWFLNNSKGASPGLKIDICSFSYKRGMPRYRSEHGGGFVFDCRAPHNPGRYEQYKNLTGRDKAVIDFLETDGEMPALIESAYEIVSRAIHRYIERGFSSLSIAFGCTGGRHRSVFGAEKMAARVFTDFNIPVSVSHTNLGISYQLNPKSQDL